MQVKPFFQYILGILGVLLIIWVGLEARNSLMEYRFIGADASEVATITVVGEADNQLVPDVATLNVGVEAKEETAEAVKNDISKRMNAIMKVAKEELGIEGKDLQTQSFNVYPSTRWDPQTNRSVEDGFMGSQYLKITIRNVEQASQIIDKLVNAGADSVGSLQFVVDNQDQAIEDLRKAAIEDAREKAQALADDLGVELVRLVGYAEPGVSSANMKTLEAYASDAVGMGGAAPEIAPGSQEVVSHVQLIFEIR